MNLIGAVRPEVAEEIERLRRNSRKYIVIKGLADSPLNETEMGGLLEQLRRNTEVVEIKFYRASTYRAGPSITATTSHFFFSGFLSTHPSLTKLDMRLNKLNDAHAILIAEALKTNTSLKNLNLISNSIGEFGFLALLKSLRGNKSLETLDLGHNQIRLEEERGANTDELSVSIEKSSLKILNLDRNCLGDIGVMAIAEGIQKNKTIVGLSIHHANARAEGCRAIALALRYNDTLCRLSMVGNPGGRGANGVQTAFETSLKHMNYSVERIFIDNGHPSNHQPPAIRALCEKNRRMKQTIQHSMDDLTSIPLGVWPQVFELVECKPDYLYKLLKEKPDVCRERHRNSRRRKRTATS